MPADSERWARRQYGWGIAFAVALAINPVRPCVAGSRYLVDTGRRFHARKRRIVRHHRAPARRCAVNAAAVAAAEATLAAAAQNPVDSMNDVMDAAQTAAATPVSIAGRRPSTGGVTVQAETAGQFDRPAGRRVARSRRW
ncbi:MAG: hypothetical protein R3A10_20820 [Caldilineaceae bacterium]